MEEDYATIKQAILYEDINDVIQKIEAFLVMCPYSREAHIQLLYCHYISNDWVAMERLLRKLMAGTHQICRECNSKMLG